MLDLSNKAFLIAQMERKNVFLIFHASWCGGSKKLDKVMILTAVKNYFQRVIFLNIRLLGNRLTKRILRIQLLWNY
jgi:hypothetical protein